MTFFFTPWDFIFHFTDQGCLLRMKHLVFPISKVSGELINYILEHWAKAGNTMHACKQTHKYNFGLIHKI